MAHTYYLVANLFSWLMVNKLVTVLVLIEDTAWLMVVNDQYNYQQLLVNHHQ